MSLPELGKNLVEMFNSTAARKGDKPFLWEKLEGEYRSRSWAQVEESVRALAAFLRARGVQEGDRVAVVGENCAAWCIADLAIMSAKAITVPTYTTYTSDDYRYVLQDSGATVVLLGDGSIARRLLPALDGLDQVHTIVSFRDGVEGSASHPVIPLEDALSQGREAGDEPDVASRDPDAIACIIYTSGTGGTPKGVMLTHRNILANIRGVWHILEAAGCGEDEAFLSFLPLSHSYEHTVGLFLPIAMGAQIYYAEGVEHLQRNLTEAKPTILPCVPRLFEVLRQRIEQAMRREKEMTQRLFHDALRLGRKRYENGGSLPLHERAYDAVLERTVRNRAAERFGGRLRAMVSGGAPLNYEVGLFFTALGLPVLQGYGQTETSPVVSVNPPGAVKLDTVGPPLRGVEVEIAEDGEIVISGDCVMKGYWNNEEATAEVLSHGRLHTGDIGEIDEDGYLKITDRKKDLIVISGGDNIAPSRIEGIFLLEDEIAQIIISGDQRPHLVALVVPSQDLLSRNGEEKAALSTEARERLDEAMKRCNQKLSPIERVRRWDVLGEPFSIENGLMTPTMKPKRGQIVGLYRDRIDALYR